MVQSPDPGLAVADTESDRAGQDLGAGSGGDERAGLEELQRLVQEGLEKGVLTYDELAAGLEDVELTREQTEDFYTYLIERGVELVEGETLKQPTHEQPALAEAGGARGSISVSSRRWIRCGST
jgi:hypothetical protein